ncbi:unnamed protein product [Sphagnum troendelagicum]
MMGFWKVKCNNCGVLFAIAFSVSIVAAGLLGLHKPLLNGCIMTYMYPTYIPIPRTPATTASSSSKEKYGLYLYHEGWKKIDYQLHLVKLSGVPVLFIPGNGGSYKQMRSIAAESDRAYNGGPLDGNYYQHSSFTPLEAGLVQEGTDFAALLASVKVDAQYANHLDWFAVDLEGEHSAMDGWILEEHSEYVVQAVHRILDRYRDSFQTRTKHNNGRGEILPKSVILVGHSMGGFVARAAVVHRELRKGAVETVLTLSSPHRSPPLAVQPSFGHFFSRVNDAWISGFRPAHMKGARWVAPSLSNVVVVSVAGGARDYQVRSRMASLDGLVPPTNGLTIGSSGMVNVFLSMEHQSILWCNQMAVQVAHTLLQLIDGDTGQQIKSPQRRMAVFVSNLRSALPQTFDWLLTNQEIGGDTAKTESQEAPKMDQFACPTSVHWEGETPGTDLYIDSTTMTVLAMDGRRRWLDIEKLAKSDNWFVLVTNLAPCVGVRVHLWTEKAQQGDKAVLDQVLEVTMRIAQLPSGPSERQIEPGGQTEQPSPSGVLRLRPRELAGFKFLTVSVAPHPSVYGRPPPAASMAVGQFYNPQDGWMSLSLWSLVSTLYKKQEMRLGENHPLVWNLSIAVSLGTLPVILSVKTVSCGIQETVLAKEHPEPEEIMKLCKVRCFPPVALVWDPPFGLEVLPNLESEIIVVDSAPAIWGSSYGSEQTTILLMVDPHCAYDVDLKVSLPTAASRFHLVHGLQIAGLCVAVVLFALTRQARAWETDIAFPSVLACIEANLQLPLPFLILALGPLLVYYSLSFFGTETPPPFISFIGVSLVCYLFANGIVALLAIISSAIFHSAAFVQVLMKLRFQAWQERSRTRGLRWWSGCCSAGSSLQVIRKFKARPLLTVAVGATVLVFLVHPSLGLIVLLLVHTWSCHSALCSHRQQKILLCNAKKDGSIGTKVEKVQLLNETGLDAKPSAMTFGETQLEIFHQRQGLLLLHFITTVMLAPSLVAWVQRSGLDRTLPSFLDSVLTFGIILHGLYSSNADANISLIPLSQLFRPQLAQAGLSFIYAVAGLYCYFSGLALAPYRAFYALAIIGGITTSFRLRDKQARAKGEVGVNRHHFHRH